MNPLTNLPEDLDTFLQDVAQMFETEDGKSITYQDIIEWAKTPNPEDKMTAIKIMRKVTNEFDSDFEDEDVIDLLTILVELVLKR